MWLMGSVLVWFSISQSYATVNRILQHPVAAVQRQLTIAGNEPTRQVLVYQAAKFSRHVQETWEMVQLGLGGALLAISILTPHRSRVVTGATVLMTAIVVVLASFLTPAMNELGRSFDFGPAGMATQAREQFLTYRVWHTVLELFKTGLAVMIAVRLTLDFYDFGRLGISKRSQKMQKSGEATIHLT
jgi:hypothetical protein